MLVPFVYDPPPLKTDVLNQLIGEAPAALPEALQISKALVDMDASELYEMAARIEGVLGNSIDARLRIQYALSTVCAQKVIIFLYICGLYYVVLVYHCVRLQVLRSTQAVAVRTYGTTLSLL